MLKNWKGNIKIITDKETIETENDITYLGKAKIAEMLVSDKYISKIILSTDTTFGITTTILEDRTDFLITGYETYYDTSLNISIEVNQMSNVSKSIKCIALYSNDDELITVAPAEFTLTSGASFFIYYKIAIEL